MNNQWWTHLEHPSKHARIDTESIRFCTAESAESIRFCRNRIQNLLDSVAASNFYCLHTVVKLKRFCMQNVIDAETVLYNTVSMIVNGLLFSTAARNIILTVQNRLRIETDYEWITILYRIAEYNINCTESFMNWNGLWMDYYFIPHRGI